MLSPCRPASQNTASAMTIADLSPKLALQRLLMLYENGEHRSVLAVVLKTKVREYFTITEKAPTRAFSWLKAPTSAFTFKMLCLLRVKSSQTFV